MNFLYNLVLFYVKFYRFLVSIVVKLNEKKLTKILISKFRKMGVNLVLAYDNPKVVLQGNNNAPVSSFQNNDGTVVVPTITIHNPKFFTRLAVHRSIGFGESYMEGWWDCDKLEAAFELGWKANFPNYLLNPLEKFAHYLEYQLFNLQTIQESLKVAEIHYDQGNEVFEKMLGPTMNYTCAYWRRAKTLDEAQTHKMDLIAHKLKLQPGMRVLDLGCGWGALARHLAKNYQVSVVAVNIGKEGCKYAEKICQGLPVEVRLCDYRTINEKFDRIVSIGMTEHVGPKNYETFFEVVDRCLVDHGLFLQHTIGNDDESTIRDDPWNSKYVYINGALPRAREITWAARNKFNLEDWHNFGPDYSKTVLCWYDNLVKHWPDLKHLYKNPESSFRLWELTLRGVAGCFTARGMHLWQIVFSKNGYPGGYESVR